MSKHENHLTYPLTVAGITRHLPICPVSDTLFIGAFIMLGDVQLTEHCARALLARVPAYDLILTAESKGIPLAQEMARQSGQDRYIVARKSPKLYMRDMLSIEVKSITTAQRQTLILDGGDAAAMRGRRVLIVDDVVSTGDSLRALEALAAKADGHVVGRAAVLAEGEAALRADLIFLEELPLFTPEGLPISPIPPAPNRVN